MSSAPSSLSITTTESQTTCTSPTAGINTNNNLSSIILSSMKSGSRNTYEKTFVLPPLPPLVNSKSKTKTVSCKNFLDSMTIDQKKRIDTALGKFFFGCNIPFNVINSKYFTNFMHELRPAYKPPCRQTLSGSLLDAVHKLTVEHDLLNINAETVLVIDGWKNSSNNTKNVVVMLQTADGKMAFLESYDFTGNNKLIN